ncbi:hypothetical protein AgCh_013158 [Apium graveolens]
MISLAGKEGDRNMKERLSSKPSNNGTKPLSEEFQWVPRIEVAARDRCSTIKIQFKVRFYVCCAEFTPWVSSFEALEKKETEIFPIRDGTSNILKHNEILVPIRGSQQLDETKNRQIKLWRRDIESPLPRIGLLRMKFNESKQQIQISSTEKHLVLRLNEFEPPVPVHPEVDPKTVA